MVDDLAKQHAGSSGGMQLFPWELVMQMLLSAIPAQQAKLGKSLYCALAHCMLLFCVKTSPAEALAFAFAAFWSAAAHVTTWSRKPLGPF